MLVQAAAEAAGGQQYPAPALYVVATPIGNLADMTLRALHVLALVDAIACEDTRHSAALLRHFDIAKPLLAVHEHNEREAAASVIARLARGERVACISDAGTPAISDPGAALVAMVRDAGFSVVPIPGASSALAALAVAGDISRGGFCFVGFLPSRGRERTTALEACARAPLAQILFEAPHRIAATLTAMATIWGGERRAVIARELTKLHESVYRGTLAELAHAACSDANLTRGEITLVVEGAALQTSSAQASPLLARALELLLTELPPARAAAIAAQLSGVPRSEAYALAQRLRAANGPRADS
jgi:16S rRNA (cytidine1402-2'-O)-methyltransferase